MFIQLTDVKLCSQGKSVNVIMFKIKIILLFSSSSHQHSKDIPNILQFHSGKMLRKLGI